MSLLDLPRSKTRSTGIDLMRTFLALWVVFAHTVPWTVRTDDAAPVGGMAQTLATLSRQIFQPAFETNPAVLAFIVLSGYCIHRNGLRREQFDVRLYAIRRFFRIVPTYIAAIGFGVALFLIISPLDNAYRDLTSTDAISLPCLAAKAFGITAFTPTIDKCAYQGNAPLRTVAVEMWLYVLYPLVLLTMLRIRQTTLILCGGAIVVVVALIVSAYPWMTMWWHNDSIFGYVAYWWIGAAALHPIFSKSIRRRFLLWMAALAILTALLYLGLTRNLFVVEAKKLAFAVVFATALPSLDRFQKGAKWTEMFGRAGYSIYAFHVPVVVTLIILGAPWWLTIASAFAVGLVMYFVIERPLDRVGRWLAERRATAPPPP